VIRQLSSVIGTKLGQPTLDTLSELVAQDARSQGVANVGTVVQDQPSNRQALADAAYSGSRPSTRIV
jgi:hypothetical protein